MRKRPNGSGCITSGYKRLFIKGKYYFEHRLIMEKHLGRKLTRKDIVHHINGDTLDNRIDNLVVTTRPSHATHHYISDKTKREQFASIQHLGSISPRNYNGRIVTPHIQEPQPEPTKEGQTWNNHKIRKGFIVIKCKMCSILFWQRKDYKASKNFCQYCSGKNANKIRWSNY